jgi:RNA polymerase sigma-70 factor (ECF subfamily)
MSPQTAHLGKGSRPGVPAPPDPASTSLLNKFEAEALVHLNGLFRTAIRLLHDHDKACDAVQETYLIAWKSFYKRERGTICRTWLFQVLFNLLSRERRRPWFKWTANKDEDMAAPQLVASLPAPEHFTNRNILAVLDNLPTRFREVLLLADVEEFSCKEISEILKAPDETIQSRLSLARALLRARLADVARSDGVLTSSFGNKASARPIAGMTDPHEGDVQTNLKSVVSHWRRRHFRWPRHSRRRQIAEQERPAAGESTPEVGSCARRPLS